MRMRKKKNLAPRMEACGAYLIRDPFALRGRWRERSSWGQERNNRRRNYWQGRYRNCCRHSCRYCSRFDS